MKLTILHEHAHHLCMLPFVCQGAWLTAAHTYVVALPEHDLPSKFTRQNIPDVTVGCSTAAAVPYVCCTFLNHYDSCNEV